MSLIDKGRDILVCTLCVGEAWRSRDLPNHCDLGDPSRVNVGYYRNHNAKLLTITGLCSAFVSPFKGIFVFNINKLNRFRGCPEMMGYCFECDRACQLGG